MSRVPEVSELCSRSDHAQCPHIVGARVVGMWRRRPASTMVLCPCACHAACPVSGEQTVPQEVWVDDCDCPGAAAARAAFARGAERRREMSQMVGEVDFSDHPDAEEIETRLRAVFEEHGQAAPPGLAVWSRVAAAGKAHRGTRSVRMLGVGARGVLNTIRWSHEPAADPQDGRATTHNGYRVAGVVTALASLLTGAAVASSGTRRLVLTVAAAAAWMLSGYAVTVVTVIAQVSRAAETHSRAQDLPSR